MGHFVQSKGCEGMEIVYQENKKGKGCASH